jgi:hypothetical protein
VLRDTIIEIQDEAPAQVPRDTGERCRVALGHAATEAAGIVDIEELDVAAAWMSSERV